ncbi:MAG TPA: hypothetical protein VF962_02690 [Gemmatimonadaceae bacterium]
MADNGKDRGYKLSTALFFVLIIVVIVAGKLSQSNYTLSSLWIVILVAMLAFVVAIGFDLQRHPLGILISERNLMSLSRFQLASWTILICSAFVTLGVTRVFATIEDPLAITVPQQLWQILGISFASTVGASMVIRNKTRKEPAKKDEVMEKVAKQVHEAKPTVEKNAQGLAYANESPSDARITDMFEGDELSNTAYIDISKLQMFLFTVVALIAYGVNIYQYMFDNTPEVFDTFPALSPGLVTVLGISHAAYLGSKSIDHTKHT